MARSAPAQRQRVLAYQRPNFIEPYRCRNVLIEGATLRNSPMWVIRPVLSTNVTGRSHGPNNDGCDPDSSRDVLIENCVLDTGDDCIAIKSARNNDGRRIGVPPENIVVRNCTMKDGHGDLTLDSEVSGSVRNVFVEGCMFDSPYLGSVLRFKTNAMRGGIIKDVFVREVTVNRVSLAAVLRIELVYGEGANSPRQPIVRNVDVDPLVSSESPRVLRIKSFAGATIDGVRLTACTFKGVKLPDIVSHADAIRFERVTIAPDEKD